MEPIASCVWPILFSPRRAGKKSCASKSPIRSVDLRVQVLGNLEYLEVASGDSFLILAALRLHLSSDVPSWRSSKLNYILK